MVAFRIIKKLAGNLGKRVSHSHCMAPSCEKAGPKRPKRPHTKFDARIDQILRPPCRKIDVSACKSKWPQCEVAPGLSLRNQFTDAARRRMNARADSEASFGCDLESCFSRVQKLPGDLMKGC